MSPGDAAAVAGAVIGVGGVLGTAGRYWIRNTIRDQLAPLERDTMQLRRNGGSSVADAAMVARDSSLRTEKVLNEHLIQSAATHARHDTLIQMLIDQRR